MAEETVVGIVVGLSKENSYPLRAQYFCSKPDCPMFQKNTIVRVHSRVGFYESVVVDGHFSCIECGCIVVEDKTSRQFGRYVVASLINEIFFAENNFSNAVSFKVILRDELCDTVQLAKTYAVVGVPTFKIDGRNTARKKLEASSVREICVSSKFSKELLANNIGTLFEDRRSSPYSFVLSLAYLFGQSVSAPGTFFRLKLLMLMSLALKNEEKLHLIAYGRHYDQILRLFDYGRRFVDQSAMYSIVQSNLLPEAKVSSDYGYIMEAGLINLAADGVFVINLDRLSLSEKLKLAKCIEFRRINVDLPLKMCGGLGGSQSFLLNCTIWSFKEEKTSKNDVCMNYSVTFLNTEVLSCDNGSWFKNKMVNHLLKEACYGEEETDEMDFTISDQEMYTFLNTVRSNDITIPDKVKNLLQAYFATSRLLHETDFSSNGIEVLLNYAVAIGKLSLRSEVSVENALLAIRLYEEVFTESSDCPSQLGVTSLPHFYDDNIDQHIGLENDERMKQFEITVNNYVANKLLEE